MKSNILLILLVGVAIALSTPLAYADTYRGEDYSIENMPNNFKKWTGGLPTYIEDYNGDYVPYLVQEDASMVQVETEDGSFVWDKSACAISFYRNGYIEEGEQPVIGSDSFVIHGALNGTDNWNQLSAINGATCQTEVIEDGNDVEVRGTKHVDGQGTFVIRYIKAEGADLKTQLEVTNLNPAWNNHKLAVIETLHVPDNVKLGDTVYNVEANNGTFVGRTWIQNHGAEIVNISDNINYEIGLGWDQLWGINVVYEDNTSKLVFDYSNQNNIILPGETLILDPTFSSSSNTFAITLTDSTNDDDCADFVSAASGSTVSVRTYRTFDSSDCIVSTIEWDTSSIPDNANITDTRFKFEVSSCSTFCSTVDIVAMSAQPSVTANSTNFSNVRNGATYSNANHLTVATNYDLDLGTTADSNVQSNLLDDWFAVGLDPDAYLETSNAYISSVPLTSATPNPTLEIVYSTPPNEPTSLTGIQTNSTNVQLSWTAPTDNGGSPITGYVVNRNQTSLAVIGNVTTYDDNTISSDTFYNYTVQATNAIGNGTESTPSTIQTVGVPDAPTNLVAVPTPGIAGSIDLSWTAPSGNVTGYGIERETPIGDGFAWVTDDTASPLTDSSLANGTQYNYRIYAYNAGGNSTYSSDANATTLEEPGVPTNVTASVVGALDILVSWDAPADIGSNTVIEGYNIIRSVDGGAWTSLVEWLPAETYNDLSVAINTTYAYAIIAKGDVIDSNFSASSNNATIPYVPDAPTNLSVESLSTTDLKLTWTAPVDNGGSAITSYRIEYESPIGDGWTTLTDTGNTNTEYTGVFSPATQYNFRVNATNIGTGPSSITAYNWTQANPPTSPSGTKSVEVITSTPTGPGSLPFNATSIDKLDISYSISDPDVNGYLIERSLNGVDGWTVVESNYTGVVYNNVERNTSASLNYNTDQQNEIWYSDGLNPMWDYDNNDIPAGALIDKAYMRFNLDDAFNDGGNARIAIYNASDNTWLGGVSDEVTIPTNGVGYPDGSDARIEFPFSTPYKMTEDEIRFALWKNSGRFVPLHSNGAGNSIKDMSTSYSGSGDPPTTLSGSVNTSNDHWYLDLDIIRPDRYTDTSLNQDTTYFYRVASIINPIGPYSPPFSATTGNDPDAPDNVLASFAGPPLSVLVSWDAPVDIGDNTVITGYDIIRSVDGGSWLSLVNDTAGLTYDDSSVALNTTYAYSISAKGDVIDGNFSASSNAIATPSMSNPPTGLVATPQDTNTSMYLDWTAADDGVGGASIFGYKIERQIDGGGWSVAIADTGSAVTNAYDTGLSTETTYDWRVSANSYVNTTNPSAPETAEFSHAVVTLSGVILPSQLAELTISANMTYGIPDTTVDVLRLYADGDLIQTTYPSETMSKNDEFTFPLMYNNKGDLTPTDYQVMIDTSNGEAGQVLQFTSNIVQLTQTDTSPPPVFNQGLGETVIYTAVETRSSNYTSSDFEFIAQPVDYDLVVKYIKSNDLNDVRIFVWEDVVANTTASIPVLADDDYYISFYHDPSFVFSGNETGGNATIPSGYQATTTLRSTQDPDGPRDIGIESMGDLFGLPMVFIFVIGLAAVFTGRSAPMGIIFIVVTIGMMAYMGLISFDFDPANASNTATWAILIIAMIIGVFVGKRWD
jgi:titin